MELFTCSKTHSNGITPTIATAIKLFLILSLLLSTLVYSSFASAKTFYLDGSLASNCTSGNYSIANRACNGSDGIAYNNLADASSNLAGGDTLYVRAGTYVRRTNNNNGSLSVSVSGTVSQHTVVRNYTGEQPIICTDAGKCQYNPNPGQGDPWTESGFYYPNPAISIGGDYIDVIGFKTYGMTTIRNCHDSSIQDCDLGGGGPGPQGVTVGQAQVVLIHTSYNILVKNNKIHHSSLCRDGIQNSPALMIYWSPGDHANGTIIIEQNEFYDNWYGDVRVKDTRYSTNGTSVIIRYNFFKPSTIYSNTGVGVEGINQYPEVKNVYIHNNIFLAKYQGIFWKSSATDATIAYNNTFVNCVTDVYNWLGATTLLYNNLYYHSNSSQKYYDLQANPLSNLTSNYNLFYSTGTASWYNLYRDMASNLSGWRSYSGKDSNSLSSNPNFVNSSGSTPHSFKRTSYTENFTSSSYGTRAGAYQTGNEVIGVSPPAAPKGLRTE